MAIVSSYGQLQRAGGSSAPTVTSMPSSVSLYGVNESYGRLYRTQPAVRKCVDFLGRNVAQLGIHIYKIISDTDRARLRDHQLALWLGSPNPGTTCYRLVEAMVQDVCVYGSAFWLKVRLPDRLGLVRLPPEEMSIVGGLFTTGFVWTVNGQRHELAVTDVVHFGGYISPLESLRGVLAEERAARDHRQHLWANAARVEGVVTVSDTGPNYTPEQVLNLRGQWQEQHASAGNAGKTAFLPKGFLWNDASWSSKDSDYILGRKLNEEQVASLFHIPLPMVGILDHATFSNIKEQHKHLYQDCLGPLIEMLQQELERQLLPECRDRDGIYVEFNFHEKLKGSFEEQSLSLQMLIGRPIMTANEGRARLNLPASDDPGADELAAQQGGPAAPPPGPRDPAAIAEAVATVIAEHRVRQDARLEKVPVDARPATFFGICAERWDAELEADLVPLIGPLRARLTMREAQAATLTRLELEAER